MLQLGSNIWEARSLSANFKDLYDDPMNADNVGGDDRSCYRKKEQNSQSLTPTAAGIEI